MKKKEYRKILKEENHITYRNAWHLGCVTCYFVMILLITTLLVFLNELPVKPFLFIYLLATIFIAIPTIIIDQLNDKQMHDGLLYYEKNHRTHEGISYVSYLILLEFIAVSLLVISLSTIYFRFLKSDYKEILLGDTTTIRTNKVTINKAFDIYLPKGFNQVDEEIDYEPDNINYRIIYSNQDDVTVGIYFTDSEIKESEIYNHVSSLEYYLNENNKKDLIKDLNTISFTDNDSYYYLAYYSYKDKLVQVTYKCPKNDMVKWNQGFVTINDNINFV